MPSNIGIAFNKRYLYQIDRFGNDGKRAKLSSGNSTQLLINTRPRLDFLIIGLVQLSK